METDEYLSVNELGKALGVSSRTARRYCTEGIVRATKPKKDWLVDPSSVEELKQALADHPGSSPTSLAGERARDGKHEDDVGQVDTDTDSSPGDGQEADSAAGSGADAGQTNGRVQEDVAELGEQVEQLRSRIDRLGRMHADKIEGLEETSHRVWATTEKLKFALTICAAVFVAAIGILSILFGVHMLDYAHVPKREQAIQLARERSEEEAVNKRLDELTQAVEGRGEKTSRDLIVVREDVRPIPKDTKEKAVIADSKKSGRPSQRKASEPVLLDWDSIGR